MSDKVIRIIIQQQGAQGAQQQLQGIGGTANTVSSQISQLKSLLASFGVGLSVKALIGEYTELSDTYTEFSNRIAITTKSQAEQLKVMSSLMEVANDTRQPIAAVGEAYEKLRLASEDTGISSERLIGITQTLFEAFTAAGNSASSARALVNQFTVALDQGFISGRQFRTFILNSPLAVKELGKALGITTAQMFELGRKSEISSELLLKGFDKAGLSIHDTFETKVAPTFSGEMDRLWNIATEGVGKINIALGKIGDDGIGGGSGNGGIAAKIAHNLGDILGHSLDLPKTVFGSAGIVAGNITPDILRDSFRRPPSNGRSSDPDISKFIDSGPFGTGLPSTQPFLSFRSSSASATTKPSVDIDAVEHINAVQQTYLDNLKESLAVKNETYALELTDGPISIAGLKQEDDFKKKSILSATQVNKILFDGTDIQKASLKFNSQLDDATYNQYVNQAKQNEELKIQAGYIKQIGGTTAQLQESVQAIHDLDIDPRVRANLEQKVKDTRELALLSNRTDAQAGMDASIIKLRQNEDDVKSAVESTMTGFVNSLGATHNQLAAEIAAINGLPINQYLKDSETAELKRQNQLAQLGNRTDATAGAERSLSAIQKEASDTGAQIGQAITDGFSQAEDAIVSFTHTGKLSFSSMVDSIRDDMTRLFVKQGIEAPLSGFLLNLLSPTAATGSAAGVFGSLTPRAAGGRVWPGEAYIVGENGPEPFFPTTAGTIIPNGQMGGSHVTIINVSDPLEIARHLNSAAGQDAVINVIRKNPAAARQALGR